MEASFQVMDLDKFEPFDPAWGTDAKGEFRMFVLWLWVLTSDERNERTTVFFRVFKVATVAPRTSSLCA
ncbi:hypothetical protein ACP70R_009675 [Stipagrostis hirtigluma subsp. patula]